VIEDFPNTAQKANIQCENCHGPQGDSGAHTMTASRVTLSSDNCATCHGEPLRHGRFQQWQLSGHANFELAIDEGESGSCSRCHTANGFLAWLPVLLDDDPATDPLDDVEVTWAPEDVQPLTCVVCHDPHDVGTVSGANTDATVRIYGDTPPLIGGFQVFGAGGGAICMTCHNSRRGLRNDDNFDEFLGTSEAARAPHGSSQADVLMGQNAFLVEVGVRGQHSFVEDTCVACHMTQTPPPDILSYNQGGTNHTFFAASDVCAACHTEIPNSESIEIAFNATSSQLKLLVEAALLELMGEQFDAGNSIDLGGDATVSDLAEIASLDFGEARGRQAITVTLAGGDVLGPYRLPDVLVLDAADAELGGLYDFADPRLIKAGWNWNLANNDGSKGSHNPSFVFEFLDASIDALNELAAE
jgi:formate-dependent nitrite reductase cytochrome c552 subunit